MQIHITKDGQQYGPFPEAEVIGYLRAGQFSGADLAWREGSPDWDPLSQLVSVPPPVLRTTQSVTAGGFSDAEILEIANRQAAMIWLILGSMVAIFIPFAPIVTGILSAPRRFEWVICLKRAACGGR